MWVTGGDLDLSRFRSPYDSGSGSFDQKREASGISDLGVSGGMSKDEVQAQVRDIDGQLVLDDPMAVAVARATGKYNCWMSLVGHLERVMHFRQRIADCHFDPIECVIVIIHVDDTDVTKKMADDLLPGHDWQAIRDLGQTPFARGLADRGYIQAVLDMYDTEAAEKLRNFKDVVVTVMFNFGVAEVFA